MNLFLEISNYKDNLKYFVSLYSHIKYTQMYNGNKDTINVGEGKRKKIDNTVKILQHV